MDEFPTNKLIFEASSDIANVRCEIKMFEKGDEDMAINYKKYVAIFNQNEEEHPVVTVLENTLGQNIIWSREGRGRYIGFLQEAFPINRTYIEGKLSSIENTTRISTLILDQGNNIIGHCVFNRLNDDSVGLFISDIDGHPIEYSYWFDKGFCLPEIRVYPQY